MKWRENGKHGARGMPKSKSASVTTVSCDVITDTAWKLLESILSTGSEGSRQSRTQGQEVNDRWSVCEAQVFSL